MLWLFMTAAMIAAGSIQHASMSGTEGNQEQERQQKDKHGDGAICWHGIQQSKQLEEQATEVEQYCD